jgi:hypothetical protein
MGYLGISPNGRNPSFYNLKGSTQQLPVIRAVRTSRGEHDRRAVRQWQIESRKSARRRAAILHLSVTTISDADQRLPRHRQLTLPNISQEKRSCQWSIRRKVKMNAVSNWDIRGFKHPCRHN